MSEEVSDLRARALQVLYAAESTGTEPALGELPRRVRRLVEGVWEHRDELDRRLAAVTTGWRIERMPPVDRNVLRIGAYELLHTEIPVGVAVAEAVKLAKAYSTANSGRFVNGVLARIAREARGSDPDPVDL